MYASRKGKFGVVDLLLDRGADVNAFSEVSCCCMKHDVFIIVSKSDQNDWNDWNDCYMLVCYL